MGTYFCTPSRPYMGVLHVESFPFFPNLSRPPPLLIDTWETLTLYMYIDFNTDLKKLDYTNKCDHSQEYQSFSS